MIKKIAQVINEANLVLEHDVPGGGDHSHREDAPPPDDIFHGEEVHVYSSPRWLQPGVSSSQMDYIFANTPDWIIDILEKIRHDETGGIENLKSLIRLILRPHYSSTKSGVVSDDVTSSKDLIWLQQISNAGLDNLVYQVLQPILKRVLPQFDISPEKEHELVDNSNIITNAPAWLLKIGGMMLPRLHGIKF